MVINVVPNSGAVFRIYATANDTDLSEGAFMQRAARTDCRVTGNGTGSCTPAAPAAVSVPEGNIDDLVENQVVSGIVNLRGWAIDAGCINGGQGIDVFELRINGTPWSVSYGEIRTDVGNVFGDARFNSSGFRATWDTTQTGSGPTTIQIRYHSTVNGNWNTLERQVNVHIDVPVEAKKIYMPLIRY